MGKKNKIQVPEPALRRLPWYLAYVKLLQSQGETVVSSTFIAKSIGVDPALVAKDLSYVAISGKTRVGYEVAEMIEVLEEFLGFTRTHKAYIFGVGNLGASLLQDKGLSQYGLEVVGGFDVNPDIVGHELYGVPIYHLDDLAEYRNDDIPIGILTVPVDKAQDVTNRIIEEGGVKAIWNFTPFRIIVPDGVVVQNTSMYAHLAVMFNRMSEQLNNK